MNKQDYHSRTEEHMTRVARTIESPIVDVPEFNAWKAALHYVMVHANHHEQQTQKSPN